MTDLSKEDLAGLVAQLQEQAKAQASAQPATTSRFGVGLSGQVNRATGFSIPCKVPVGAGSVRVDIHFPAEMATQDGMFEAMNAIDQAGLEVDVWQPRGSYGGNRGGFGGSGYGNGGGRYGSGGRYGR